MKIEKKRTLIDKKGSFKILKKINNYNNKHDIKLHITAFSFQAQKSKKQDIQKIQQQQYHQRQP